MAYKASVKKSSEPATQLNGFARILACKVPSWGASAALHRSATATISRQGSYLSGDSEERNEARPAAGHLLDSQGG
jgi:hypothetical protein